MLSFKKLPVVCICWTERAESTLLLGEAGCSIEHVFILSFGKDNRFLTSVSVRPRYLWSSAKAVPRQVTLWCRYFTICHFLVLSCGFSWPLAVCLAVSGSMGAHQEMRNSSLLLMLHRKLMVTGVVCSVHTVSQIDNSALKSSRKCSWLGTCKLAKPMEVVLVFLVVEVSRCSWRCWALVQAAAGDVQHGTYSWQPPHCSWWAWV